MNVGSNMVNYFLLRNLVKVTVTYKVQCELVGKAVESGCHLLFRNKD